MVTTAHRVEFGYRIQVTPGSVKNVGNLLVKAAVSLTM